MSRASRRHLTSQALNRLTGVRLNERQAEFVYEYTVDYDYRRAALVIGLHPDQGSEMLANEAVQEAVRHVYNNQMRSSDLTPETIKEEMYRLYNICLQTGKYAIASRQLDQLARHSHIDAYAAQRVAVAADAEVARALMDGRRRLKQREDNEDAPVSFL